MFDNMKTASGRLSKRMSLVKLEFHGSSFLVVFLWHPRDILADTPDKPDFLVTC